MGRPEEGNELMTEERITLNDWLGLALDAKRRILELHPDATVYVEIGADDDGLPGLPRFFAQGESIHDAVAEATVELFKHSANFNSGTRIEDNVHDFSCTPRDPKEGDTIALGQVAEFKFRARSSRLSLERARKAFAAGDAELLRVILQSSTGIGQPPLAIPGGWLSGTMALDEARGQANAIRREFGAEATWAFPWDEKGGRS